MCFRSIIFYHFQVQAGVGLSQTRIIINGDTNTASISARNNNAQPYLVSNFITENWIPHHHLLSGMFCYYSKHFSG